ncbi:hypothetical protein FNV43_RR26893 [Rhamnella rubrinervis]|uniref:MADS-box domain-containing protein n=1 Tax=Rhamnella rubrinervis TaxID=2594499 RepID=A0A8K0DQ79_9ROSA|nr:hypothetical protein FNV43_RR26893 [Rhamnella rubrinervis]
MGNRRKVSMERIENKQCRLVSFTKRRKGLFKKAEELQKLTGSDVAVLVLSEAGVPYFHGSHSAVDKFLLDDITSSSTAHCVADDDHRRYQAAPQSCTSTGTSADQNDVGSEVGSREAWRAWMSNVEIDEANCEKVEDLMALKNNLEGLKQRVASKITAM